MYKRRKFLPVESYEEASSSSHTERSPKMSCIYNLKFGLCQIKNTKINKSTELDSYERLYIQLYESWGLSHGNYFFFWQD